MNAQHTHVTAYIGDSTDVLRKVKQIENANRRMAKAMGKNFSRVTNVIGQDFDKMSRTYKKALDPSTGKEYMKTVDSTSQKVKLLNGKMGTLTKTVYDQGKANQKTAYSFKEMDKKTISLGQNMKKLASRAITVIPIWLALRGTMMGFIRLIKNSVKFLIDWEYQMSQLAIVGKASKDQLESLSNSMLNLSTSLGISNKSLGEAGKLYLQQGRAIKEIIPLMSATAKLSLLTGRTITQSVEDMTAVLKAYKLEASEAINVVDSITSTMLSHAITAGDLAAAYKQVASTAASLGVSFSALTGLITAIKTTTRDAGSKIGLSLRTMFTRISTSSAEALQAITLVPFFLDKMGKATKNVTPNMRNLENILFEMAGSFDNLTNAQQSQVAKLIGGIRRTNQVFALFNNFTEAIDAQTDSLFGLGKADDAVRVLTDTTKLRIEQLSGAWSEFVDTVADTGVFKGTLDFLKGQIQGITVLLHPSKVLAIEVGKRYDEQIESLSRQKNLVNSILISISRAKSLEEILSRDGGNIELIQRQVQSLIRGINEAGKDFKISVGAEIKDPKTLITSLKSQFGRLEALTVQARIEIPAQETLKEMSALGKIIEGGIKKWDFSIAKWGEFGDAEKELTKISGILKSMVIGAIISDKDTQNLRDFVDKFHKGKDDHQALLGLIDKRVEKQKEVNALYSGERKLREGLLKEAEQKNSLIETEFQLNHQLNQTSLDGTRTGRFEVDILEDQLDILNKQKDSLSDELFKKRLTIEQKIERIYYQQGQNIKKQIVDAQLTQLKNAGALQSTLLKTKGILYDKYKIREKLEEVLKRGLGIVENIGQESKRENKLLINYQLSILKMQGASNRQLLEKRRILEETYNIDVDRLGQIKTEYDLQKAITKEKLEQGKVSSETLKLYKLALKYGPGTARGALEFLKGEKDYPKKTSIVDRKLKKALDEFFSSAVEARKAFDYFSEGAGRYVPTREKGAYPYDKPQKIYKTDMGVWKSKDIPISPIKMPLVDLKLPKIETNIDSIKIELKKVLTDKDLSSELVESLSKALKPFIEDTIEKY